MNKSMRYIAFFLALPMVCLMACSSHDDIDETIDNPNPKTKGKPLLIEVTETPMTDRTNSTFLGNGDSDYMFFIPQTITGWSGGSVANTDGAYIEIRCSITKGNKNYAEDGAVYIPFSAVLEKGFIHRFNIRMGTSLRNAEGLTINFRDQ